MNENDNKITFNASDVLLLIKRKWKHLLIVCSVALIASLIISYCVPERYKSTVVLYPANSTSVSQTLATDENTERGLLQFGEKEEVEQMMQMLQSNDIRNRIIEKYNLIEHYRIDPDTKYLYTKLYDKYEDNVKISRTEYTSVKVDVLDESPDTAAMIANDISQLLDTVYARMQRDRAYRAVKIVETAMLEQEALVKNISDSLENSFKLVKDKINLDPAAYVGNVREEVLELYAKYKVIMARFTPGPVKNFFVWYRERTIEGNPTMSSDSYKGNLEEVKEKIRNIRKK